MLPIATWFLLIALSFTNGLITNHHESPKNEDSIDSHNSENKLSYMFDQKRTNKTPEVEKKEEEVEKYTLYKQEVTYTSSKSQPNNIENSKEKTKALNVSEAPIHHLHQNHKKIAKSSPTRPPAQRLQEYRQEVHSLDPTRTWENLSYLPPLLEKNPSLSVTPKWKDLNDILKYHPNLQISGYALKISPHRHHRHKNPHNKTSEAAGEKLERTINDFTRKHVQSTALPPVSSTQLNPETTTTIKPKPIKMKQRSPARRAHQLVNRGSYKFRMDDINDMRL